MRFKKIPPRGELLDLANCILDGADCLVIGPETSVGMFPVETVQMMSSACKEAEACVWTKQILYDFIDKVNISLPALEQSLFYFT